MPRLPCAHGAAQRAGQRPTRTAEQGGSQGMGACRSKGSGQLAVVVPHVPTASAFCMATCLAAYRLEPSAGKRGISAPSGRTAALSGQVYSATLCLTALFRTQFPFPRCPCRTSTTVGRLGTLWVLSRAYGYRRLAHRFCTAYKKPCNPLLHSRAASVPYVYSIPVCGSMVITAFMVFGGQLDCTLKPWCC